MRIILQELYRSNKSLCSKTENVVKEFEGHNRNIERNEESKNDDINDNYFLSLSKNNNNKNNTSLCSMKKNYKTYDFSSKPCELYNFAIATVIMLFLDRDANT